MSIPAGSQPRIYMTGSKKTSHPDPTADLLHGSVDITRQGGSPYSFHRPSLFPCQPPYKKPWPACRIFFHQSWSEWLGSTMLLAFSVSRHHCAGTALWHQRFQPQKGPLSENLKSDTGGWWWLGVAHGLCGNGMLRAYRNFSNIDLRKSNPTRRWKLWIKWKWSDWVSKIWFERFWQNLCIQNLWLLGFGMTWALGSGLCVSFGVHISPQLRNRHLNTNTDCFGDHLTSMFWGSCWMCIPYNSWISSCILYDYYMYNYIYVLCVCIIMYRMYTTTVYLTGPQTRCPSGV